jgi:hypothetical protein
MEIIVPEPNFELKQSEVHLMPCKIMFNGESDVKSFFSSSIIKCSNDAIENNPNQESSSFKTEGNKINKYFKKRIIFFYC